jgi:tRNA(Arg) A34 adenosine deaminase TadA
MEQQICIDLPSWVAEEVDPGRSYPSDDDKMAVAVRLAAANVRHGLGGPFGAAVFEEDTGRLVAVGVNRVLEHHCSTAHAEVVALMLAHARLGTHRLDDGPACRYALATSAQPCAMCYGAVGWAGISRLIIGARREDVEAITGFDEGPLHPDWKGELEKRGTTVVTDVLREAACDALRAYHDAGGAVY